jgi:beta-N-acetylhexosaminidase
VNPWLVCGVGGSSLDGAERRLLEKLRPGGIILFARNVAERKELEELAGELRVLPSHPYLAVDLEGGRVNRLEGVLGPLPPPAEAAACGPEALAALGAALGAACAHLGIDVDYAPVVDVAREDGWLAGERRCLGATPAEVVDAARPLIEGIEGCGVRTCLKHYPGLGSGEVDSHRELPLLSDEVCEDEAAFRALAAPQRAVMVAHALCPALGEPVAPASLSSTVVRRLRRVGCGPVIADDLGMGALAAYGSLPERAAAALLAGCDQVPVCNALGEREAIVDHVRGWAGRDPLLAAALGRSALAVASFGRPTPPAVAWGEVGRRWEKARRACGGRR